MDRGAIDIREDSVWVVEYRFKSGTKRAHHVSIIIVAHVDGFVRGHIHLLERMFENTWLGFVDSHLTSRQCIREELAEAVGNQGLLKWFVTVRNDRHDIARLL